MVVVVVVVVSLCPWTGIVELGGMVLRKDDNEAS